jgi:hypothetical protein
MAKSKAYPPKLFEGDFDLRKPVLALRPKNVVTINSRDVSCEKDIKKALAPIFNSIADKHSIPLFIDDNGDDVITDEDEYYGLSEDEYDEEYY